MDFGFPTVENLMVISHLPFADDTQVLCGADVNQIYHLSCILLSFEVVSGLRINSSKSEMVPIRAVDDMGGAGWYFGL